VIRFVTGLALAAQAAAAASDAGRAARPAAPPGLSWEDADHVTQTVARLERRLKAGKPASREPIAVSEKQVNSYVTLALAKKIPPSVTGLTLSFQPGTLAATGMVDLDAVKSKLPTSGAGSLLSFLSGTVPVELRGRLQGANGQGKIEVEQATVSGISLPPALIAQMLAQATRSAKLPGGFDLLSPFPLPWTAKSVRLEAGRAVVEFAQQPAAQAR
jgi:hypothetical protein